MIYFDNAATGGFKINAVSSSAETVIKYLSANPGRSGHRLATTGAKIVFNAREAIADMFCGTPERVVFTKNCTEALNTAIFGTVKNGGHVITTVYEHNSVLRPLYNLKEQNRIELDVVSPENGDIVNGIKSKIKDNTYLIVCSAVSNVTGEILPVKQIYSLCKKHGILLIVDGAQGGGHIPLSLNDADIICLAGHKGLMGIMGSGVLVFRENVEIAPLIFGGTGTESFSPFQPLTYPEKLEAGTLNLPAVSALYEGVVFVKKNLRNFAENLINYSQKIIDGFSLNPLIKCYSKPNPSGIVAFSVAGASSDEISDILSSEFDIAVRGGFHCAPKMHEYLGTEKNGLVRVSLAVQNSTYEINYFLRAINNVSKRFNL